MRRLCAVFFIAGILAVTLPSPVAAVEVFDDVCKNVQNNSDQSAACRDKDLQDSNGNPQNPLYGKDGVITKIVNLLSIVVGITTVIMLIMAGFRYITSGTNPQEVTKAREVALYALVGVVIAAAAQLLVRTFLSKIGGP